MTRQQHTDPASSPGATPELADVRGEDGEWSILHEELVRGILHAINNRIAALSAFVDLAALDGAALEVADVRPELTRLLGASELLSRLVARRSPAEALEVRPQLDLALATYDNHPQSRGASYEVVQPDGILPVRVPRWALGRLLLLMIDAARKAGRAPRLELTGDSASIRLAVPAQAPAGADAHALADICGARLELQGEHLVLAIPVLRKG